MYVILTFSSLKEGTRMDYGYILGNLTETVQNPKQGNDNLCQLSSSAKCHLS